MTEANAIYDTGSVAKTSTLHHVPKDKRMTFDDKDERYSRLEAMKVAKEQALIREKAANLAKQGKPVPDTALLQKYSKTLKQRLRHFRPRKMETEESEDSQSDTAEGSPLKTTPGQPIDAENIDPKPNVNVKANVNGKVVDGK